MSRIHTPLERANSDRPTPITQLEDVWTEIRKLWLRVGGGQVGEVHDVTFSLGGPIYTSTSSGYYVPFPLAVLTNIYMSLRVAGTTTTTVQVYRSTAGVSTLLSTVSLGAGERTIRVSINKEAFQGDFDEMYVQCTAAGSGAQGLTVQCRTMVSRA